MTFFQMAIENGGKDPIQKFLCKFHIPVPGRPMNHQYAIPRCKSKLNLSTSQSWLGSLSGTTKQRNQWGRAAETHSESCKNCFRKNSGSLESGLSAEDIS